MKRLESYLPVCATDFVQMVAFDGFKDRAIPLNLHDRIVLVLK
jgi:hypothetical protein